MLGSDYLENYQLFVDEILEQGEVWGIVQDDGWAICDAQEDNAKTVIPFWSSSELAAVHCSGEWQEYRPEKIDLQDFVEEWLPGMKKDLVLLGPNWNNEMEGLEIDPSELISMFK